jgi:hypothetical protein
MLMKIKNERFKYQYQYQYFINKIKWKYPFTIIILLVQLLFCTSIQAAPIDLFEIKLKCRDLAKDIFEENAKTWTDQILSSYYFSKYDNENVMCYAYVRMEIKGSDGKPYQNIAVYDALNHQVLVRTHYYDYDKPYVFVSVSLPQCLLKDTSNLSPYANASKCITELVAP